MSDLVPPTPRPLGGRELQFLRQASNKDGCVAGHNNKMVIALERDGLVAPHWLPLLDASSGVPVCLCVQGISGHIVTCLHA